MAYKIIVKKRFTAKLIKLLYYLEAEWGKPIANHFVNKMEKRLDNLSKGHLQEKSLSILKMFAPF